MENMFTSTSLVKPLPTTGAEMLALRLTKRKTTLNDAVETALLKWLDDEELQKLLNVLSDDESFSGKWREDHFLAAMRLKELEKSNPVISSEKITVIQRSIGVVMRRYGLAVDQRRASALPAAE